MILNRKIKYIILLISTMFLIFSINYIMNHVSDMGFNNYNIKSNKMEGTEEFLLYVEEPTTIRLAHNAVIGSGEVSFNIVKEDGEVIEEYCLNSDTFLNKVYDFNNGIYKCTMKRNVSNNKEKFSLYYDRRYVTLKHLVDDSETSTYN